MNRKDLISAVKKNFYSLSKRKIDSVLYFIEKEITDALLRDEKVLLKGFLHFETKITPSRSGILNEEAWSVEEKTKAVVSLSPAIQKKITDNKESMKNVDIWEEFGKLPDDIQYILTNEFSMPELVIFLEKCPHIYRNYKQWLD